MEVRKRKSRDAGSPAAKAASAKRKGGNTASQKVDTGFTVAIVAAVLLLSASLAALALVPDHVPAPVRSAVDDALSALGLQRPVHAVVLDAGSTGSRVLAFTFHRGLLDGRLRLDDELWREVKPGISSYAEEPAKAAESIRKLLDMAKSRVPEERRAETPVVLKATAGLRLLPEAKAEAILAEVEKELAASGFAPEPKSVEIMDATDEGLFGWFTVNFLSDRLSGPPEETFVTLDLGGGSTQISLSPADGKYVLGLQGRKGFVHDVSLGGRDGKVYSHSYLGLGLMAAREAIFRDGNAAGATELKSPCFTNHQNPAKWKYQNKEYTIVSEKASFENCLRVVNRVVNSGNVHMPQGLADRDVAAFSYFYDRGSERRLIPEGAVEGSLPVSTIIFEAQRACDPYSNSDFYCADLAYISALLTKGYGIPPDKEITLFKKVDGHEVSWALGLAYKLLEEKAAAGSKA